MENKTRNIWQNLGLALLGTPLAFLIVLLSTALIDAVDNLITKIQMAGYWWIIPIIFGFIPSFFYFTYESSFLINKRRGEITNSLILYLRDKLQNSDEKNLSQEDIEEIKGQLLERIKIWAWYNPKLWTKNFPDEKYSKSLFGIVDNLLEAYKKSKSKSWPEYLWKTNLKSVR